MAKRQLARLAVEVTIALDLATKSDLSPEQRWQEWEDRTGRTGWSSYYRRWRQARTRGKATS
jgi:hypothetical protein